MKKLLAMCLAICILIPGIGAQAEDMTAGLENVTLIVKNTLGISDEFTEFNSDRSGNRWYLNWTGDGQDISVTASGEGKIYSYYIYEHGGNYNPFARSSKPSFPDSAPENIIRAAEEFAALVLDENEAWHFERMNSSSLDMGDGERMLTGRIELEGMASDVTADITVDMENLKVTAFFRSDCYMEYVNAETNGTINADSEAAKQLLMENMPLALRYYVVNYGEEARLVYMPAYTGKYLVRAEDGELMNIEEIYASLYEEAAMETSMDAGGANSKLMALTEAEKAGIEAYEGVMSVEQLDALVRAMTELGVTDGYILHGADYYSMDNGMSADLSYARPLTDDEIIARYGLSQERIDEMRAEGSEWYDNKSARLDAYTGEIEYFDTWRSRGGIYGEAAGSAEDHRAMVDGFIEKYMGDTFANVELKESGENNVFGGNDVFSYIYSRVYGGYPFPDNFVRVTVNAADGTIDSLEKYWDENMEFADASPVITADEAAEIYFSTMRYECAYISVPADSNASYETVYERILAWHFNDDQSAYAVDAVTGEALSYGSGAAAVYEYSDLEDIPQKEKIEKLALYGVGFSGGEFGPAREFTVSDMLTFVLCMDGETGAEFMDHAEKAERAMYFGAGDYADYDPMAGVTKAEFARALVGMAGYGNAAQLSGIYSCGFSDEDEISDEAMGAVAIAYALGYIYPDDENRIGAGDILTRAEGAEIAYGFLASEK